MTIVRPVPGFVPPVVLVPAANTIVPFLPGAVGVVAGAGATIAGAPALGVIGAAVAGAVLGGVIAGQLWGSANGGRGVTWPWPFPPPTAATSPEGIGVVVPAVTGSSFRVQFVGYPGNWAMPSNGYGFVHWWEPYGNGFYYFMAQGITAAGGLTTPAQSYPRNTVTGTSFPVSKTTEFIVTEYAPPGFEPVVVPSVPGEEPKAPPPLPLPEPVTEPDPLPNRPTLVPPFTTPKIPGSRPASPSPAGVPTPTTPRTSPPPATLPDRPLTPFPGWPVQPRVPGTATTPDGTVAPTPKPPVVKTPTNVHVVDGIPIPGNGPRPTPEGTAQELGRIEKKLARLLDPGSDSPEQPKDRLGWLRDNLADIIDFFQSITAGGTYQLSTPCQLDENGDRVVKEVAYAGAPQSLGVISNKIDALAQLLQEHKDLKQPICRETPATGGQAVTVNFVQID